ncbi:hypothetical protein [Achromobacter phage kwar_LB4]|nr:hypothetical protein [Achromobacter phage kwar_LB4]
MSTRARQGPVVSGSAMFEQDGLVPLMVGSNTMRLRNLITT